MSYFRLQIQLFKIFMVAVVLLFGTVACSVTSCNNKQSIKQPISTAKASQYVTAIDGRFERYGKPYNYVGVNFWYGAYLGSDKEDVGDRSRLIKELDLLHTLGVRNLRVLGGSEQSALRDAMNPAIRDKKGVIRPDILDGLDFLLVELAKRDMTAVIYLTNYWEWSGGMATYVNWADGSDIVDPSDPNHPWPAFAVYSAKFYRNTKAKAMFQDYAVTLLERVNSISGIPYKNDPTIMSWQLANEPRPGHYSVSKPYLPDYYQWLKEITSLIKSKAPHQLVSIGSEGVMGCVESAECVIESHHHSGVDYMTFHLWLKNWGWFDATRPDETFDSALSKARAYIKQHQSFAQTLGMPVVLEEFGLERDGGTFSPGSPTTYRDTYFAEVFSLVETSVKNGGPLQGTNLWAWGGFGKAHHADYRWRGGDKHFTGDPPQEAQGLNSVLASDESTLRLIRQHAQALVDQN